MLGTRRKCFSNNIERNIKIKRKTKLPQENHLSYSRQFVLCLTRREPKNANSIVQEKGIIFAYHQNHKKRENRTKHVNNEQEQDTINKINYSDLKNITYLGTNRIKFIHLT